MHNVASGFGANGPAKPGSRQDELQPARSSTRPSTSTTWTASGSTSPVLSLSTVVSGAQWADANDRPRAQPAAANGPHRRARSSSCRASSVAFRSQLQDVALSVTELERCVEELGLGVVNLPAAARGVYLGNPRYFPLWELVAGRRLIAYVHPDGVTDPWFQEYSLWNSVGQPLEEAKVMSSLIYEGVFDRWPDLRIVMAHGGGYLPHYYGRHDRNMANRPETARNITGKPSDYLARFYYDTCVYVPHILEELVDLVGAGQIVLGSDWPMGGIDPVAFVDGVRNVGAAEAAMIKGGNAASAPRRGWRPPRRAPIGESVRNATISRVAGVDTQIRKEAR